MAEWTTEKEFDRPSTEQKDGTKNVPIKIQQLTDRQQEIYDAIRNGTINGTINAQILSEVIGASLRTIKRELYALRDMNLIQFVGSNKTGHWEVVNNQEP